MWLAVSTVYPQIHNEIDVGLINKVFSPYCCDPC